MTLDRPLTLEGIGLHGGQSCHVWIYPAPVDQGVRFWCLEAGEPFDPSVISLAANLEEERVIPAHLDWVEGTVLSTELVRGAWRVRTVEHLLGALAGTGVSNGTIVVNGPEIPLLDGSALPWVEAIVAAGLVDQGISQSIPILQKPLIVQDGEAFVMAVPAPQTRLSYGIEFPLQAIGQQWYSLDLTPSTFQSDIAPARTFGFREQILQAQAAGLLRGGTLENALVCDETGWLNPPLRFDQEPVRHKLLDLLGDLSLLGTIPQAHILAYKASHKLHIAFGRALQSHRVNP